jgi:D-inositol-3-phosphate glycosyltransferase
LHPYLGDFSRRLEGFRAAEGIHYDLIHSHYWLSGQVGQWLHERWRVPHMVMFHTLGALKNLTVQEEQESELRIATERELVRTCQRILAATEREKADLLRYYGAGPEKVGVVPCGVNLELFHPLDKKKARQKLGYADDEAIVLYVGRLSPSKGADLLLKAMSFLKRRCGVRLVIIGGDDDQTPESQNLQRLSRELGIHDAVVFVGRVEHEKLPPYYSAADVVVVPSRYETFGLVALEALASGTPVVATPVGAMESIIQQGRSGEVVANGSPESLAAGIERFLAKRLNGAVSTTAIRATVDGFAWSRVASAIIREYATLLGEE